MAFIPCVSVLLSRSRFPRRVSAVFSAVSYLPTVFSFPYVPSAENKLLLMTIFLTGSQICVFFFLINFKAQYFLKLSKGLSKFVCGCLFNHFVIRDHHQNDFSLSCLKATYCRTCHLTPVRNQCFNCKYQTT